MRCIGGVAIDGREGLPQGKASLTDKLMGKAEKVGNFQYHFKFLYC